MSRGVVAPAEPNKYRGTGLPHRKRNTMTLSKAPLSRTIVVLSSPIRFIWTPNGIVMSRYPTESLSDSLVDLLKMERNRTLQKQHDLAVEMGVL